MIEQKTEIEYNVKSNKFEYGCHRQYLEYPDGRREYAGE